MKKTIPYVLLSAVITAVVALAIVGCDGDFGERSERMDDYLDKFHYSKKKVKQFTITYNGNGNTEGEAPVDDKSPYDSGAYVLVKDKGTLKNGNAIFSGWDSKPDRGGKYSFGTNPVSFPITENIVLYAVWDTSRTFEVTVTSSLAGTPVYGGRDYKPGDPVRITAGTPPDGWKFEKWTTESKGVSFDDAVNASTTFIMPENKVTVTANFVATSGKIGSLTDSRDGKTYITVTIGEQVWMAQNLDYLNDMTSGDSSWCYDNDPDNCATYGRLYTWDAAMKACPNGWHLPSREEWGELAKAAGGTGTYGNGGTAGTKLKSTSGWEYNYGTNDYGFSALPGGRRLADGSFFEGAGSDGYWWTATGGGGGAYHRVMYYYQDYVIDINYGTVYGHSVRCVGDD